MALSDAPLSLTTPSNLLEGATLLVHARRILLKGEGIPGLQPESPLLFRVDPLAYVFTVGQHSSDTDRVLNHLDMLGYDFPIPLHFFFWPQYLVVFAECSLRQQKREARGMTTMKWEISEFRNCHTPVKQYVLYAMC